MKNIVDKIKNRIQKVRFQPIRVFVFHHVSAERDPLVCQEEDWTQLDQFKRNIEALRAQYTFILLSEAYNKLQHEKLRRGKYAVLTADDGLASVQNVIPWLEDRKIPLTLFINTRYMNGDKLKPVHQKWLHELKPDADEKKIAKRMYLSKEQVWALTSPYIEVGMHGHEHYPTGSITEEEFEKNVEICNEILSTHPNFIRAFAFPWGYATKAALTYLQNSQIIPVLAESGKNYQWKGYVDREGIDNIVI